MTCTHQFRTATPYQILGAVHQEQQRRNPVPAATGDFVRLCSQDIFRLAGLKLSDTALYVVLDKLTHRGLLEVNQCPDHSQRFLYSITAQGIRCLQCRYVKRSYLNTKATPTAA